MASGGTKIADAPDGYTYHVFDTAGAPESFTYSSGPGVIEYVVVAGGGGGGSGNTGNNSNHYSGGGGGAGGLRQAITTISAGTYAVVVGTGGAGATTNYSGPAQPGSGAVGTTSSIAFPSPVSTTGGGGGANRNAATANGYTLTMNGGSGGGGNSPGAPHRGGTGTSGEGNPGAGGNPDNGKSSGGGGGAGMAAGEGSRDPVKGGQGGGGAATGFPGPIIAPAVPNPGDFATAVGATGIFAGGGAGGTHGGEPLEVPVDKVAVVLVVYQIKQDMLLLTTPEVVEVEVPLDLDLNLYQILKVEMVEMVL